MSAWSQRKNAGYRTFNRSALRPSLLQLDKAHTTFENARLTVAIPGAAETNPKQARVKPGAACQLDLAGLSNL